MHPVFSQNHLLVKEQLGLFRAANNYDIYDPQTNQIVLECREQNLRPLRKCLRFALCRRTPFDLQFRTPGGEPVLRVQRGFTPVLPKVTVCDAKDRLLGGLKQRFVTIVEKFGVFDASQQPQYRLERSLGGREFRFLKNNVELAHISKQWAGLGRELFTSADSYELRISEEVPADDPVRMLMLAAVVTVDMLLFE